MLNRYPVWAYLLIVAVLVPGFLYALPNLYGEDPAIQVTATRGAKVDRDALARTEEALRAAGISYRDAVLDDTGLRVRFADTDTQLTAREQVQRALDDKFVVALNLQPATPAWLRKLNAAPMYLGLDLRGGVHFLMEVDLKAAVRRAEERYVLDFKETLRKEKIRYISVSRRDTGGIEVRLRDAADRDKARSVLRREFSGADFRDVEGGSTEAASMVATLSPAERTSISKFALEQNITSLRNRVNQLGVAEPVIQQQGDRRIVVQLPGVQDTARAKKILGQTATLEIIMVDEDHGNYFTACESGRAVPPGSRCYPNRRGGQILLKKGAIYTGENIIDAAAGVDTNSGGPVVHITLDARGAKINQRVTGKNIGKHMAVVYIETKTETRRDEAGKLVLDEHGQPIKVTERLEEVITAPEIRDQLGKRFQIEGLESVEEARDLALLLRAGALATPIEIIEERTVGPSLGHENVEQGFNATLIGFVLVVVFMAVYYRLFGMVANIALALNVVLIIAVLSLFQATLTLPGVAGIVLTVGMAVDANVLIFERIREELRNGNSPQASIHMGYSQALSTIVDANVTTLIAAIVLFNFGTGPIKGFAVTLSIGIITSMFTAINVTRAVVNLAVGGRRLSRLSI